MVKVVVVVVMIVTAIVTSVVYHATQKADIEFYKGHQYFLKSQYPKAVSFYKKALEIKPNHLDALKEMGYAYQWTGNQDKAIKTFREILKLRPLDYKIMTALAETLSWQKKYIEAIDLLRKVIGATRDPQAIIALAEIYQWEGRFDSSIDLLKKLPRSVANTIRARLLFARSYLYTNKPDKALAILEALLLENAIKTDAKLTAEVEKLLAESLMMQKDYAKAIKKYRQRLEENPEDVKSMVMLADMLSWTARYDESVTLYEKALAFEPDNIAIKAKLARVYAWTKQYEKAETLLKDVLSKDPKDSVSRTLLADILSWQKKYKEAIKEYEKALDLGESDPEMLKKMADAASWGRDYEMSEKIYRLLLAKDPDNTEYILALAAVLSWNQKYSDSIAEYEKALVLDPGNLNIIKSIAEVYSWDKQYAKSEEMYRKIIAAEPSNESARIALGELLLWQKKHKDAIEYFEKLLKDYDTQKIRMMHGKAILYSGDYDRSRKIFEEILAQDPEEVDAKVLLADSFAYNKEFKQAIKLYAEALEAREDRETKRKFADVLSWNKDYNKAIALYDELLDEEVDFKIWRQKARVLGWARRYPEALAEYKKLSAESDDDIMKLEMEAKRAYWNAKVEAAIADYKELIDKSRDNVEAMFDLAQICSYQSMWKDAIQEYNRILEITPNHFRAKDGLAKAELIAKHFSWEPGYEFYEADSQSRDMDIRRHTIFNKFRYPVNYNIIMEGWYDFTERSFSDFPEVVENEARLKLEYIFNPKLRVDGFYDMISYNRDISAIHLFGGSGHLRLFDIALTHFYYERKRLENSSRVIRNHYFRDDFKERVDISVGNRLKVGADYLYSGFSDRNRLYQPGFDLLYYFSLDPLRLAFKYRYFYQEYKDKVPTYFSPKGFTTNTFSLDWRHYLNKEEIFFGADDLYYEVGYSASVDSETIVGHQFSAGLHWDINKRLAFDIEGAFNLSSASVYKESGLQASFKYYY